MAAHPPALTVRPPHIRLNSGSQDPFADSEQATDSSSNSVPAPRPLTPEDSTSEGIPHNVYNAPNPPQGTTDLLLPPSTRRVRDDYSRPQTPQSPQTPTHSGFSSRRGSWSSDAPSRDSKGYAYNPFDDSRAPSRAESDDLELNTQTVSEKFNIMPTDGLLLFPEDVEKDDYLHNPDPNDKERDCDIWNRRGVANIGGLMLLTVGIIVLFVGYPVISFVTKLTKPPPPKCLPGDTLCLDVGSRPILRNIRRGLIDPDTPSSAMTKRSTDGKEWNLVFSDEFNTDGRTFYGGDDPYFEGVDLWYGVTEDLEWYDPDAITTKNGALEIRFDNFVNHNLNFRSGMLQSWNKMCFTGGRIEASVSLPGAGNTSGFWPGFWTMGNLGRPGYAATTDGTWPYSYYDGCDAGITPNQSSTDGISWLPGMRLPACTCPGADHPTPGKSRSAPEIDVFEASTLYLNGNKNNMIGSVSQSLQIAPFDVWYMPNYDFVAVYDEQITEVNTYRGGPYQQAMSSVSNLNNEWYNGNAYQVYAYEYTPGATGQVTWFVGDKKSWTVDGRAIGPNGNVGQRVIPMEPMTVIMNLGMSFSFAAIDPNIKELMPAFMRFDYLRIYQDPNAVSVTCDPPGYETTGYIANHAKAYHDNNVTSWASAGYAWPQNSLMDGC